MALYTVFIRRLASSSSLSSSAVLSAENRERTSNILKSLSPIAKSKMISKRRAAVLVPLCVHNGEVSLLLTVRAMTLRNNRGQVAYPGGMEDLDDKTLLDTALRETEEEIGISRGEVDVWGAGPSVGRTDMMVTPYLGFVSTFNPNALRINRQEVEEVFLASLKMLCDPKNFRTTQFRCKHGNLSMPVFTIENYRMWGMTALITHTVLLALLPHNYNNHVQRHILSSNNLPSVVFAMNLFCFLNTG